MKEEAKNLNNTVKIEKEVISLKDILEIKIVNALMPLFFTKGEINRARYFFEIIFFIIISPLLLVSIITFKVCDLVVYLYEKFFKERKDKNERN